MPMSAHHDPAPSSQVFTTPWTHRLKASIDKIEAALLHLAGPPEARRLATEGVSEIDALLRDAAQLERVRYGEMRLVPVALANVVNEAAEAAKEGSGFSGILVVGKLPTVIGDRAMLQLAVRELMSNAFKFAEGAADARVEIECVCGGGQAILVVRDNGIGFDPDTSSRLFQPFQTLHPGSPRAGAGLGLALVRLVAERHRARVWARSQPGGPTEFLLSFISF